MFEKIFPGLFAFISSNMGSNCFLLTDEKIVLVDSSASNNASQIIASLKEQGIAPEQINLILHTHGHADHFGCDFLFKNAEIMMHKHDAERVNKNDAAFTCSAWLQGTKIPAISSFLTPNQTIDLGKLKLQVLHTPGHTHGSVCLLERNKKLLFSGDTLFNAGIGRTDLPTGNAADLLQSLKTLKTTPFNYLLPGHGEMLKDGQQSNIENALKMLFPE